MAKICSHSCCSGPVFSKKLCRFHWGMKYAKPIKKNITPLKKSRKPIAKVSDSLRTRLELYYPIRNKFLKEKTECEMKLPGCTIKATELHHIRGRIGMLLLEKSNFMACCHSCHQIVTENSAQAVEKGLSGFRNRN